MKQHADLAVLRARAQRNRADRYKAASGDRSAVILLTGLLAGLSILAITMVSSWLGGTDLWPLLLLPLVLICQ